MSGHLDHGGCFHPLGCRDTSGPSQLAKYAYKYADMQAQLNVLKLARAPARASAEAKALKGAAENGTQSCRTMHKSQKSSHNETAWNSECKGILQIRDSRC